MTATLQGGIIKIQTRKGDKPMGKRKRQKKKLPPEKLIQLIINAILAISALITAIVELMKYIGR